MRWHRGNQATQDEAKPSNTDQQINSDLYPQQRYALPTQPKEDNMKYTFREEAVIYTTVEASSQEEARVKLDQVVFEIPSNMEIDFFNGADIDFIEGGEAWEQVRRKSTPYST